MPTHSVSALKYTDQNGNVFNFVPNASGNGKVFYGSCNTEATIKDKIVTCADFTSNDLVTGSIIYVIFTNTNSSAVADITMNVNGTGAKSIKYKGNNIPFADLLYQNSIIGFFYDGTSYEILGEVNKFVQKTDNLNYEFSIDDAYGNSVLVIRDGNIFTQRFNSANYIEPDGTFIQYEGEEISLKKNFCNISNYFTLSEAAEVQGGAVYGKFLFQFRDTRSKCHIYDLENKSLIQTFSFSSSSSSFHCNNANFGTQFYDENDEFPLLYVSMESASVHNVHVYRITKDNQTYNLSLVQTITWDAPNVCSVYYPNMIIDREKGMIYQIGYTSNDYHASNGNKLKFNGFGIPSVFLGDVSLHDGDKTVSFELPAVDATQGAIIENGKIYQVYGVSQTPRSLRVIDIERQKFVSAIDLRKLGFGEQEALFKYNGDLFTVEYGTNIVRKYSFANSKFKCDDLFVGTVLNYKGSIIPDLTFEEICEQQFSSIVLLPGVSQGTFSGYMKIYANANRSCVLVPQSNTIISTPWENSQEGSYDAIFVPAGTKTITITMSGASYRYGLTLSRYDGYGVYDSGWQTKNSTLVANVSSYTTSQYLFAGVVFEGNTGSATLSSLHFSITMSQ